MTKPPPPMPSGRTTPRRAGTPTLAGLLLLVSVLAGCAMSREDRLRNRADDLDSTLRREQRRAMDLKSEPEREARLQHLAELQLTLSAANVGLSSVPMFVPADKRDVAYDILDETYRTIEWNIPSVPGRKPRPVPRGFQDGVLRIE